MNDRSHATLSMRSTAWALSGAALALLLLAACGQKGPLYLPDKKASVVKPVSAAPAAARPPEKTDPQQQDDSESPPAAPAPQ